MGGIYTQTRYLRGPLLASEMVYNGGLVAPAFALAVEPSDLRPRQTTTSYRSTGSVIGADDALALARTTFANSWLSYSPYDTGHPFDTMKQECELSHPLVDVRSGLAVYRGPLIPTDSASFNPSYSHFPLAVQGFNSTVAGTEAINRTVPNKPVADMANALGELRTVGGIPKVMGTILNLASRTKFVRSAGKEYLNSVFGWAPLVKDVENIAGAVIRSNEIVKQYLRDSGSNIRRRYEFDPVYSNLYLKDNILVTNAFSGISGSSGSTGLSSLFSGSTTGRTSVVTNHTRKVWFKGAYTYYLDQGIDPASKMELYASLARKIVGARLSPEVLWELQPWSWLVDWIFNIGQILENIESFQTDGLVLRYGYLMCTDVVTSERTIYSHTLKGVRGPVTVKLTQTRKQRIRATPYGFGLNPSSFSADQWAILVALGMTKTPTSLR